MRSFCSWLIVAPARDVLMDDRWFQHEAQIHTCKGLCPYVDLDILEVQPPLLFHAFAGCDTTSFLSRHTKISAIRTFLQQKQQMNGLGKEL